MGPCGRVPAPSPWPATWPRGAGGRGHRHAEPAQDPLCRTRERRAAGPGGTLVRMMALVAGARCPGLALCIAASDPGEATWALSALGTSRRPNSGEHPPPALPQLRSSSGVLGTPVTGARACVWAENVAMQEAAGAGAGLTPLVAAGPAAPPPAAAPGRCVRRSAA